MLSASRQRKEERAERAPSFFFQTHQSDNSLLFLRGVEKGGINEGTLRGEDCHLISFLQMETRDWGKVCIPPHSGMLPEIFLVL